MKGPVSGEAEDVAIVLLTAGLSRRFGAAKQLHPWQGRPLVRHMVEKALASRAGRVVVVTGAYRAEVEAALVGAEVALAHNPDFALGQSTSVRRGLEAAPESAAILFLPVDMPYLQSATLDLLIEAWQQHRPAAVAPLYGGQRGAPVLFDRRLFPELAQLEGDRGGRGVLTRHPPGEILDLEIEDDRQGRDLDTQEDLVSLG